MKNGQTSVDVSTIAEYNRNIYNEKKEEFLFLFRLNLQKYLAGDFITLITGFNIIDFDKDIKTPDGKSTKIWVTQKFGKKAEHLISWLIKNTGYPATEGENK